MPVWFALAAFTALAGWVPTGAARADNALTPRLLEINDILYVLQPSGSAGLNAIAATDFDLVVMDYSEFGDEASEFTAQEIAALQATGKTVLAYLSIGEAEDYRYYWDAAWETNPPSWLGPENEFFAGNYKVRYWQQGWQDILLGTPDFGNPDAPPPTYFDRILGQGFDGVYLDIVDAYYYWSEERGEVPRITARRDMVDLIERLSTYAQSTYGRNDFLIFPQNAEDIVLNDFGNPDDLGRRYLALIDGIGVESVFYDETTPQSGATVAYRTGVLEHYVGPDVGSPRRLVLSMDYVWDPASPMSGANIGRYDDYTLSALARGYIPYAAVFDRNLDEIVVVQPGGQYAVPQPRRDLVLFSDGVESGDTARWDTVVP